MKKEFVIYGLLTEYSENPINLFTEKPVFSWKAKAYNGYKQESFRICVSSDGDKLARGDYDLWDSGEIKSDRQTAVLYEGKKLGSRDRGYWFVTVRDAFGTEAKSETAYFEIALLKPEDWKGCFQTVTAEYCEGAQYWRRPFTVYDKKIDRARAYVCGLGYHEFYVNGKKITDDRLNPGVTDYSRQKLYVTYDITDCLTAGGNCLGIILANGWLGCKIVNFQIYIDYADGSVQELHSYHNANELRATYGPIKSASVYGGETYDAREEARLNGWALYDYHADYDNGWVFSMNANPPSGQLVSQTMEPIKAIKRFSPETVYSEPSRTVYDFNANVAGVLEVKVKGERGAKITLTHGELLMGDRKNLDTLNLRTAKATDVYILKGEGTEEYSPSFTYHGFRYAQIKTDGKAEVLSVCAVLVRSGLNEISEFECSDEVLNRLHKNAVTTEGDNIHSVLTDCPQRDERFGWLNDYNSRLFELRYNFDTARTFPKTVRDIAETQTSDGRIADTAPFHIGQSPADPICVAFQLFSIENYKLKGDKKTLSTYFSAMKKWVEYLVSRSENNLLEYSYYGDWVAPYPINDPKTAENEKTYPAFVSSVFYLWQVKLMAKACFILGEKQDEERYVSLSEKIESAINKKYYDAEKKTYHTGSQAANSLALSMKLCAEKDRKAIAEKVAEDIIKHGYHNTTGNQAYRHMFYELSDEGYADVLYKMITNPEYPGWGYMIANDAVSVWERWEAEGKIEMNSFNHPMFGGYDGWLFAKVAGLEFDENCCGADKLIVKPYVLRDLKYVRAKTVTAMGEFSVCWEKKDGRIVYDVVVPYNAEAKISLPGRCERFDCPSTPEYVKGRTEVKVTGGKYNFVCGDELC